MPLHFMYFPVAERHALSQDSQARLTAWLRNGGRRRIVIYGLGPLGSEVSRLLDATEGLEVVGLVDAVVREPWQGIIPLLPAAMAKLPPHDAIVVTPGVHAYLELFDFFHDFGVDVVFLFHDLTRDFSNPERLFEANLSLRHAKLKGIRPEVAAKLDTALRQGLAHDPAIGDCLVHRIRTKLDVNIEITIDCNMRCFMCFRSQWGERPGIRGRQASPEVFRTILRAMDFDTIGSITLGGGGEALLHPNIVEFIEAITGRNCPVHIITNASLLDRTKVDRLHDNPLLHLYFSIDCVDEAIYRTIRVGGSHRTVFDNIAYCMRRIGQGGNGARVSIASTLLRRNLDDFPHVIRFAAAQGIKLVHANHCLMTGRAQAHPRESLLFHPERYNAVRQESFALAEVLGIELVMPPPFQLEPFEEDVRNDLQPGEVCVEPWSRFIICNDHFKICCGQYPQINFKVMLHEAKADMTFADITGFADLDEAYNSVTMRRLRKSLLLGAYHPACLDCKQLCYRYRGFGFTSVFFADDASRPDFDGALAAFRREFAGTSHYARMTQCLGDIAGKN